MLALGRSVEHDPRSRDFPAATAAAVVSRSWAHHGAALNQGQQPSCVGNAIAQNLNTDPLRPAGRRLLRETDAFELYKAATALDNIPGQYPEQQGSTGLAGAKAAKAVGYIAGYTHAFGFDHFLGAMMLGPTACGTDWLTGMDTPDAQGVVTATGTVRGGHEYECLAVDVEAQMLTFLNSWGSWGLRGKFHMTFATFRTLLANNGDVVALRA